MRALALRAWFLTAHRCLHNGGLMWRNGGGGGGAAALVVALVFLAVLIFIVVMSSSVGCFAWMFGRGGAG